MTTGEKMDKMGWKVTIAIVLAMIVDGLDLQVLALAMPSFMKDLNISPVMAGALSTYTLIGMGLGGIFAGWTSDRVGRVRVTWWSILLFSVCTGIIGICNHYWQIAVMRFISGLGLGAVYMIGNLLVAEYVPTRIRNTVLSIVMAGWSVGYVFAALISGYVMPKWGWRPMFLIAVLPGFLCLFLMRGLTDPPSWFAARAAVRNNPKKQNEFGIIWKDKKLRSIFLLWSFASLGLQYGYYGANTWLPSYLVKDLGVDLKSMGWYLATTYATGIFFKSLVGWLGDKFGRRVMWVFTGITVAIYIPLVMNFATKTNVAYLLLVFGGLYGAPYAIFATYLSESFPTSVRGTAMATSYNLGRVGSIISPVLIGWAATNYSIGAGIATCGVAYLMCALLPGIFIKEKMYDPRAVATDSVATSEAS
ncbi:MAG: MFS transporter [Deltaproteobacteria bacterium]|nr:MFS transporter [Deltaproteobacteria bacterium]